MNKPVIFIWNSALMIIEIKYNFGDNTEEKIREIFVTETEWNSDFKDSIRVRNSEEEIKYQSTSV